MSTSRHRAMTLVLPIGEVILDFAWGHAQLVFARAGVARVEVDGVHHILSPSMALWLPRGATHRIRALAELLVTILYLPDDPLGPCARLVQPGPLARLLVARVGMNAPPRDDRTARALAVLLDELQDAPAGGLPLPLPPPGPARSIAEAILSDPSATESLTAICERAGLSLRTAERRFAEVGVRLGTWRRHARLQHAATLLARGATVEQAAGNVGYSSSSAFVSAFRAAWGTSPARWRDGAGRAMEPRPV